MEGIREAIAFITDLAVKAEKPETIEINGRTYSYGRAGDIPNREQITIIA